jgi:membrane protease subunit HflK
MMRRFQERMRGSLGGRTGGDGDDRRPRGTGGIFVLGALLAAGWVASGVYMVDEGQQAVVTRFGAYNRTTGPGLHMHLPQPLERQQTVAVTTQRRVDVGINGDQDVLSESLMLTGDQNIVDVDFTVLYRLNPQPGPEGGAYRFLFNLRNPMEGVRGVAESAMREVVGRTELEALITTQRGQVEQETEVLMQRILDGYASGVEVLEVQLLKAAAPAQVVDAFDDVVRAGQDAETEINRAQRFRNEEIPRARSDGQRELQAAQAYREQVVRDATGDAERFRLIFEQYRLAPRVTRDRLYFETLERIYRGADVMIIDGRTGVQPYLPLEQMRRGQRPAQTQPAPSGPAATPAPAPTPAQPAPRTTGG